MGRGENSSSIVDFEEISRNAPADMLIYEAEIAERQMRRLLSETAATLMGLERREQLTEPLLALCENELARRAICQEERGEKANAILDRVVLAAFAAFLLDNSLTDLFEAADSSIGIEPQFTPLIVSDRGGTAHLREDLNARDALCSLPILREWQSDRPESRGRMQRLDDEHSWRYGSCKQCLAAAKKLPALHPARVAGSESAPTAVPPAQVDASAFALHLRERLAGNLHPLAGDQLRFLTVLTDYASLRAVGRHWQADYITKRLAQLPEKERFESLFYYSSKRQADHGEALASLGRLIITQETKDGLAESVNWPSEETVSEAVEETLASSGIYFPALLASKAWPKSWQSFQALYRSASEEMIAPF